jgi:hypothetical protein
VVVEAGHVFTLDATLEPASQDIDRPRCSRPLLFVFHAGAKPDHQVSLSPAGPPIPLLAEYARDAFGSSHPQSAPRL